MRYDNTIHHADTIDWLASLPSRCARLVIADPPYNLKIDKQFNVPTPYRNLDGWRSWCEKWIDLAVEAMSDDGNLFIYGIHHYAAFLHVYLFERGLVYRRQIIWHYENGWSRYTNAPAAHYEPILWFAKSDRSYYDPIREPYKSTERLRHTITKNGKVWTPNPDGRLAGDVWSFPTLAGRRFRDERVDHPTQKPLALTRRIIRHFSERGDLVVVPFVGSGTECVAAKELDRRYTGAELNPDYVKLAESRLATVRVGEGLESDMLAEVR